MYRSFIDCPRDSSIDWKINNALATFKTDIIVFISNVNHFQYHGLLVDTENIH
jgi:hypothetical protein